MKVYEIIAHGKYCGGIAIVAADSEEGARGLASDVDRNSWDINWHRPESVRQLPLNYGGDIPTVITHYENGE